MRQQTILPALLLALAASLAGPAWAASLPNATVATDPAAPAPGDSIVLKLSGQWPDGCVPTSSLTKLTRVDSTFTVDFNYSGFSGTCTAAVTPWSLDVPVGSLPIGSYDVSVTRTRTFGPAELIGSGSFTVAAVAEEMVWLPGFFAPGAAMSLASTLTAFNNSDRPATVTYAGVWDGLGEFTPPAPVQIPSAAAAILDSRSLRDGQHVQMLSLSFPRGVALRATLERFETVPDGIARVPESLGRLELPVFTALFPAGSTAVAGDVSLSVSECAGGPEVRRRLNLTLFNAGADSATFQVAGTAAGDTPGPAMEPLSYSVPAHSLVQFNAIPLDTFPVCKAGGAWFRITGSQPFLAYISTVRPETVPGVLPFEIFPARLDR